MNAKRLIATIALPLMLAVAQLGAQGLPDVTVETFNGEKVSAKTLAKGKCPVVISFWATWCKPCIKELDAVSELLGEWREETTFRFVAVSVDDSRSASRARTFASGRGWEGMEFVFDTNSDLSRALKISTVPHVIIVDEHGKIVWRHSGYVPGDEEELYEILKESAK